MRYAELLSAAEYIYVCHRMAHDPEKSFGDTRKFCRFYVSLAKNEDRDNFILTDEVEKYLLSIAKNKAEQIADKLFLMSAYRNKYVT